MLLEIDADINAFGSADRLSSRVGIWPGNNESAGKRKSGCVRKCSLPQALIKLADKMVSDELNACVMRKYNVLGS